LAFSGFPISIAFLTGAVGMVLTRVLKPGEAYQSIEWKVVFLLAGLIPLGIAMQKTGAATLIAQNVLNLVSGKHVIILLLAVAALSTLFSLFMTNVGSIVVLAPLVISLGEIGGFDPRPLALMAAVCAANSFVLPTHQVNAFLMTSGGYRNSDYFRAGGGMTLIFLFVVVLMFYLFYI
jgi:di/tricarboxylate transporter